MDIRRSCIDCASIACDKNNKAYPGFCVSQSLEEEIVAESIIKYVENESDKAIMIASAVIEHDYYCKATRVEETVRFAKKINAKKIGIASCVGLMAESRKLANILRNAGFEVFGIGCKAGEIEKHNIGIPVNCEDIGKNICNPILQASKLNQEKTDLNIVMGLCVGHDSLFYKYSEAIVTTLVTKDRVTGHNPVAALNLSDEYYNKLNSIFDNV